ncbi:MAG: hypothetical protein IJS61_00650 [Firmicutes bacterium]|nr:hypothetical protein [Bacillota bacterium]
MAGTALIPIDTVNNLSFKELKSLGLKSPVIRLISGEKESTSKKGTLENVKTTAKKTEEESLKPLFESTRESISKTRALLLPFLSEAKEGINSLKNHALSPLTDFLINIFSPAFQTLSGSMGNFSTFVKEVLSPILLPLGEDILKLSFNIGSAELAFKNLQDTVEKGSWSILENIRSTLKGIGDSLYELFNGISSKTTPVPEMAGGGHIAFDISKIPFLAKGGIVTSPTLALLGEKGREAVIPLEKSFPKTTFEKEQSQSIANRPLVIELSINGSKFGRVCAESINELQRKTGKTLIEM